QADPAPHGYAARLLAEAMGGVAEVRAAREVADVEDHPRPERDEGGDGQRQPRVAPERAHDPGTLVGERAAEQRLRLERGIERLGTGHGNASTAARKARPRAA